MQKRVPKEDRLYRKIGQLQEVTGKIYNVSGSLQETRSVYIPREGDNKKVEDLL